MRKNRKGAFIINKKLKLGLKGDVSKEQVENRLEQKGINIYEIHLKEDDLFGQKYKELDQLIADIKAKGIKVYLHHPMTIQDHTLHVNDLNSIRSDYFYLTTRMLVELCEKHDIYVVVHINYGSDGENIGKYNELEEPEYADKNSLIQTVSNMLTVDETIGKGRILWENGIVGVGAYREDLVLAHLIAGTDLKLCFDISHAFITLHGNNHKLQEAIWLLNDNIAYYHVVDSIGKIHDSLVIGEGLTDFPGIIKYITEKDYIYEIVLNDLTDCTEMMKSHQVFQSIYQELIPHHYGCYLCEQGS